MIGRETGMQNYYIGTYTNPILFGTGEILQGKGKGIYRAELDEEEKTLNILGVAAEAENPSYLTVSADKHFLYAVNELKQYENEDAGSVSAYRIIPRPERAGTFPNIPRLEGVETFPNIPRPEGAKTFPNINACGDLELVDRKSTHGQDPCFVASCLDGKAVIVANFMTGSVCSYAVDEKGTLKEMSFVQHQGSSIHPVRQKGPHAHSCIPIPGTDKVLVPDLGIDKLLVYQVMRNGELLLCENEGYDCLPGSGPRFGEFLAEKNVLYIINELESTISVLDYDRGSGKFFSIQQITTLPAAWDNICADLHITPDGRFLFASNRGHDSITSYKIQEDGTLKWLENVSCGGKTPRNFAISESGKTLLVGNQDTDEIVLFAVDQTTGILTEGNHIQVPTPVCICRA